jgi:hypothetical protein
VGCNYEVHYFCSKTFSFFDMWSSLLRSQKMQLICMGKSSKKSLKYKKLEKFTSTRIGCSHLQNLDVHIREILKFKKFSRFQKVRKFTYARLEGSYSQKIKLILHGEKFKKISKVQKRGSSHIQDSECSLMQNLDVHIREIHKFIKFSRFQKI